MKKILIIAVALLFLFNGCKDENNEIAKNKIKKEYQSIFEAPPGEMIEFLEKKYRLNPDRRFLMALNELNNFYKKKEKTFDINFEDNKWHIRCEKEDIGELPEFPDFSDMMQVLFKYAVNLNREFSWEIQNKKSTLELNKIKDDIEAFFPKNIFSALRALNKNWVNGSRYPELLKYGTRALVLLSFQCMDYLDISDLLFANAMAYIAITKAYTGDQLYWEQSMLSYAMGYASCSEKLISSLSKRDGFSLFVLRKNKQLKELAENNGSKLDCYCWLIRISDERNIKKWKNVRDTFFKKNTFELPIIKTGYELYRFGPNIFLSTMLPNIVMYNLAYETDKPDLLKKNKIEIKNGSTEIKLSSLIRLFELNISKFKETGPFLKPDILKTFFYSYFYSGLYRMSIHLLYSLSSAEAAGQLVNDIGEHEFELIKEFKRWYSHLVEVNRKKSNLEPLLEDIFKLKYIKGKAIEQTFDEIKKRLPYASPELLLAAKNLARQLDTRPEHRRYIAQIAYTYLFDLKRAERIINSIVKSSVSIQFPHLQIWHAKFNRDKDRLIELLSHPEIKLRAKVQIVNGLTDFKELKPDFIQDKYTEMIRNNPDNWYVVDQYVKYLTKIKKYNLAQKMIKEWLHTHDRSSGFDYINARKELAKLYMKDSLYNQGLSSVEPVVSSWQAGALETKARLLSKMGKKNQAIQLAKQVIERYPNIARSRAILAGIYWENNEHSKAAETLKMFPFKYESFDWKDIITPIFIEVFENRPEEETLHAFSELVPIQMDVTQLMYIPDEFSKMAKPKLAFQMQSKLRAPGMNNLLLLIKAYTYLKQWKDKPSALQWLKTKIPKRMLGPATIFIYWGNEFDLLWDDWFDNLSNIKAKETLWLMRAAASLKTGGKSNPKWEILKKHYANKGISYYHEVGQFLIGILSENKIIQKMKTPKQKCEIAYYIGLKKEFYNDIYSASDWYRACVETGLNRNLEYQWAFNTLNKWALEGKFLSKIKE
jgi:hypothetical protein